MVISKKTYTAKLNYMQYFQERDRRNCLIRLTQYPPLVLALAPALRLQVTSAPGHLEKFLRNANGGDETWVIYLVLPQDKSKLNATMNVDYCKLLAHNILNMKIVERRLYF